MLHMLTKEKNEHPLLRNIPHQIWSDFYKYRIQENVLPLINSDLENIYIQIRTNKKTWRQLWRREQALMTILCSHPNLENQIVNKISRLLQLGKPRILNLIAIIGDLSLFEFELGDINKNQIYSIYKYRQNLIIKNLIKFNHLDLLIKFLELFNPDQLKIILRKNNYELFRISIENNSTEIFEYFVEILKDDIQEVLAINNYDCLSLATSCGNYYVFERILELMPHKINELIEYNNYVALREAAKNGYYELVKRLTEIAGEGLLPMLAAENYSAIYAAIENDRINIVNYFLSYPHIFQIISEQRQKETIDNFIDQHLVNLRTQQIIWEFETCEQFDIQDGKQIELTFLILRYMIIAKDDGLLDNIRFLINIPTIRELVSTHRIPYEIFRIAIQENNFGAVQILMTIPDVRENAGRYITLNMNMRQIAGHGESSMQALSLPEEICLRNVRLHYQKDVNTETIPTIMQKLKRVLEIRYLLNPATILLNNGIEIHLPLKYEDFLALELQKNTPDHDDSEFARALKAYFKNKTHTALRYISKPNHWIDPYSPFIDVDPEDPDLKWSRFEQHQTLIALFFHAAIDPFIPPTDGFTLDTRLEHFIEELAFIGRAHNWDKHRNINPPSEPVNEEPLVDSDGEYIELSPKPNPRTTEEYDDEQKDRPSCSNGVTRRLLHSVLGNPICKLLTTDILDLEIAEMVKKHFTEVINKSNYKSFQKLWDQCVATGILSKDEEDNLRDLNIPECKQEKFIQELSIKYEKQFTENDYFVDKIKKAFSGEDPHIVTFGYIDIDAIFEQVKSPKESRSFFFGNSRKKDTEKDTEEDNSPELLDSPRP